jgi:poly-gamma-glutamate capsule biosynthesis protein CapA/YwtB (metallophosphatase superfamily)
MRLTLALLFIALLLAACRPTLPAQPPVLQPSPTGFAPSPAAASPAAPSPSASPVALPTQTAAVATGTYQPVPTDVPLPSPTLTPTLVPTPTPAPPPRLTLLFTGIMVPARCVQAAIDQRGDPDFVYSEVRHLIAEADLAVGTLNASLSDISPRTGCVSTFVLAGAADNADAMQRAGFDVMSVATNHIKNCAFNACGDRAFLETLDNLNRVGILPVGAGVDHAAAMQPVVVDVQGVRFGIVSLGQIEPLAFAGPTSPGIAVLNEENLRQAIAAAREVSDVVIAMPHWGPEYSPAPNHYQLRYAAVAVEAGADLVVGNHTHVVQAVEVIGGVPVFYGLGNFVFDQDWSRETMQSVILRVHYEGTSLAGYELIPVFAEGTGQVRLAEEAEAAEILNRIEQASRQIRR